MADERDSTPADESAATDAKERMRAALERKKLGGGAGPGVGAAQGGAGATHGKVGGKREFRRKSS